MQGLVIKNTGNRYEVLTADGGHAVCNVKGNFRLKGLRTTNPVAVGDHVEFDLPEGGTTGYITAIEPRRNYIIRRASNLSKESHILAANIDQVALIVTLAHPATSLTFIDRLLATAEAYGVEALLVINKTDLLDTDEDREMLDAVCYLYESIGYRVMRVCASRGEGLMRCGEHSRAKSPCCPATAVWGSPPSSTISSRMPVRKWQKYQPPI